MLDIKAVFAKYEDEYCEWQRVKCPRSGRPDLHAFLLLEELVPGKEDIVTCAEHDAFWLSVDKDVLARVATEEQILELVRCGVMLDDEFLKMFA